MSRPQYLNSAIESVRKQSFTDWELIIVHDGDDPRIAPVLHPWLEKDDRIRYFHRPIAGNIGSAMNYGIAQSNGCYLAVLDDDDIWIHPDKLRMQVNLLDKNKALVAVGGGAVVVNECGQEKMRYLKPTDPSECARQALFANPLIHSSILCRKTSAEAAGGYDSSLCQFADWDFCLKLMRLGAVANIPEYFVTYRVWRGGSSSINACGNARSAIAIINRHGSHFRGYLLALAIGICHLIYAYLPRWIRGNSDQVLSRLKKRFFSTRSVNRPTTEHLRE